MNNSSTFYGFKHALLLSSHCLNKATITFFFIYILLQYIQYRKYFLFTITLAGPTDIGSAYFNHILYSLTDIKIVMVKHVTSLAYMAIAQVLLEYTYRLFFFQQDFIKEANTHLAK